MLTSLNTIFSKFDHLPTRDFIKISLLVILIFLIFSNSAVNDFYLTRNQQFSHLAYSFLHGHFNLMENTPFFEGPETTTDAVNFNGSYYWSNGPFPAIVLMPGVFIFSLFHLPFWQGYLGFFISVAVFILCFKISRRLKFSRFDSLFLAAAFCFASMFIALIGNGMSWMYAQTIVVALILWSIYEYLGRRRWWLIGTLFGAVFLTRSPAGLGIIFFVLSLLFLAQPFKTKIRALLWLLIPFIIISSFSLFYNFARFGSVWQTGYTLPSVIDDPDEFGPFTKARQEGFFSLAHIPGNLYYAFLATPQPIFKEAGSPVLRPPYITTDGWGLSIFVTSPYLLYLLFKRRAWRKTWVHLVTIIAIAVPIFLFYGIGFWQFGYRYALDFFPFLFMLFALTVQSHEKRLPGSLQVIIIGSIIFNFYLLSAIGR